LTLCNNVIGRYFNLDGRIDSGHDQYQPSEAMIASAHVIARLVRATRRGTVRRQMARTSPSL
jgi:hypothetical protein